MRIFVLISGMALATYAAGAGAQSTPSDLSDLVGARASGGETQLEARGYVWVKTETGSDRKWSYWWNASRRQCISVATFEGRYDSIVSTLPFDCNQQDGAAASTEAPPEIIVGGNGEGEVIFSRNNCVAYYDAAGRRKSALPACSSDQRARADDAMARYRREQGTDAPAAGHSPDGDGDSLRLTCFGDGRSTEVTTYPILHWDKREKEYDTTYVNIMSQKQFDTMVQIDVHDGVGHIWLPKSLQPVIHSRGDHGWWQIGDLELTPDRLSGRYRLNGLNKPTLSIDRRTGRISIKGQRAFSGMCEPTRDGGGQ